MAQKWAGKPEEETKHGLCAITNTTKYTHFEFSIVTQRKIIFLGH
jgi:hypothetical protein